MKKTTFLISFLLIFLFLAVAFGQDSNNGRSIPNPAKEIEELRQRQKAHDLQNGKDENGMIKQPPPLTPQTPAELKEIFAKKAQEAKEKLIALKEAEQRLLAPHQYYEKFAAFLKDKKTGLARLFVDKGCGIGKTVLAKDLENCGDVIPVRGGGAFYSFRYKSNHFHGINDGWDIYLYKGNKFLVGNETVQSVIADIGNINLEEISLKSKAFDFLDNYNPAATVLEIKEKSKILRSGISANGYNYSNIANVNLDSTYVFRTVAYKTTKFASNGIDLTLAFRIVGQEADGSWIILWKEFKNELPRRELH